MEFGQLLGAEFGATFGSHQNGGEFSKGNDGTPALNQGNLQGGPLLVINGVITTINGLITG